MSGQKNTRRFFIVSDNTPFFRPIEHIYLAFPPSFSSRKEETMCEHVPRSRHGPNIDNTLGDKEGRGRDDSTTYPLHYPDSLLSDPSAVLVRVSPFRWTIHFICHEFFCFLCRTSSPFCRRLNDTAVNFFVSTRNKCCRIDAPYSHSLNLSPDYQIYDQHTYYFMSVENKYLTFIGFGNSGPSETKDPTRPPPRKVQFKQPSNCPGQVQQR